MRLGLAAFAAVACVALGSLAIAQVIVFFIFWLEMSELCAAKVCRFERFIFIPRFGVLFRCLKAAMKLEKTS
jgi:hypothetical protein